MPSPLRAVDEAETGRSDPSSQPVEVYVEDLLRLPDVRPGWYAGTVREWTRYPVHGWTAFVQYRLPGEAGEERWFGRFLARHVRPSAG